MLPSILVGLGIIFMVIAIGLCYELNPKMGASALKKHWHALCFLIIFFLVGYIFYFINLFFPILHLTATNILISSILCLGAVFVVAVIRINMWIIDELHQRNSELNKANGELKIASEKLNLEKEHLIFAEKEMIEKNKEMDNLLQEFYTLRLTLEKGDRKIKKENKGMKKSIDRIRRKK